MRLGSILVVAALLAGCSSSSKDGPLVVHPVTGKVNYDGKPAEGVEVTLIPTDAPMVPRIPRNPRGVTGPDGRFSISTFAEGDGAAEGGYQVVLSWPPAKGTSSESEEAQDADRLLGWYDAMHSTLSVRVKSGTNEIPTINAVRQSQPPPPSPGIPGRN
jgi:5-hydroxyisourate hydrolase-like protein (transthyretin family)